MTLLSGAVRAAPIGARPAHNRSKRSCKRTHTKARAQRSASSCRPGARVKGQGQRAASGRGRSLSASQVLDARLSSAQSLGTF